MNDNLQQAAARVRDGLAKGNPNSATAKRLDQIVALLDNEARANLATVLRTIYPTLDLAKKTERTTALSNLRKYREVVANAATDAGIDFSIQVDGENRKPPSQRLLWVEYGDSSQASTSGIEYRNQAEVHGIDPIIKPEGHNPNDLRPLVHYYTVFADDPVDARFRRDLLKRLDDALEHTPYRFRRPVEVLISERTWPAGIEQKTAECQFGLLFLTYKFLDSRFLEKEERFCKSAVIGNPTPTCIPVALGQVSPHDGPISSLPPNAVLFGPNGLSWSKLGSQAEKEIFVDALKERVVKHLEATAALTKHIAKFSDDEAAKEFPACFTRTRGAKTDIRNTADRDPDPDPASANREDALDFLINWIEDPKAPLYCALLAEYGMGKTTTSKALTRELTERRARGEKLPLPIYFDLRPIGKHAEGMNLQEILTFLLHDAWKTRSAEVDLAPGDIIARVQKHGAVIIWDGLDEVLVHLDTAAGQRFTRQLYSILPPGRPPETSAGGRSRLLITCRTHYFRTLPEQKNHFLAEERDTVRAENYRAFILLPFNEEQIRQYIQASLPDEDTSRVIETFDSVHNLRELAERPYTLSLLAREFANIELWKKEGRRVTGLTLYKHMVQSWLLRDTGKHTFKPDHKQFLMEHFAARLLERGQRYWSIANVENWLAELLSENPLIATHYAGKAPELLEEDLRTATFLVRDGDDKFRFAHTSLQEYFLAGYLRRALVEGKPERWQLPRVSNETLNFLGQWLLEEEAPEQESALATLENLRDRYRGQASVLAFGYFLLAHRKGYPSPSPAGFQLPGADLDDGRIEGTAEVPLMLSGANFRGATLNQTRWTHCNLEGTCFEQASVERAEFVRCHLPNSQWSQASLEATLFRHCGAGGAALEEATLQQTHFVPPAAVPVSGNSVLALASGHSSAVWSCAWSPDGRRLASAVSDQTVRLWDATTGKLLQTLQGHSKTVRSCAWSPDGRRLASAADDQTVRLWDASSGKLLQTLEGHSGGVNSCAWSPDGATLASAGYGTVRVWDGSTGKVLQTLQGHSGGVHSCAFSPDGGKLASAGYDGKVHVWDGSTGKVLQTLQGHSGGVHSCAWSPDGRRLASAGYDGKVRVWGGSTGKLLQTLQGHSERVSSCAWSPDGRRLASAAGDGTVRVWDATTGKLLQMLQGHSGEIYSCAWSPDGRRLASAGYDGKVRVWDGSTGKLLQTLQGHSERVSSCAWSPDGRRLASAADGTVRVWDGNTGKLLQTLQGHSGWVSSCAWSPDGRRLASAAGDGTVRVWDGSTGKLLHTLQDHSGPLKSCVWSPDGRRLASVGDHQTVRLWDVSTGELLQTLEGHPRRIWSCAWNPDGGKLASATYDGTVRVWDGSTGKLLRTLQGHSDGVSSCAWSPDGRRLASALGDQTVRVWDATTGKLLQMLQGHSGEIYSCAWSPDGRLAAAGDDRTVRLWDASTGKLLQTLQGHSSSVWSCAWSPDGRRLASAAHDGTVRFWDPDTGHQLPPTLYHFRAPDAPPSWAALDLDANRILSCGPDAWRSLGWLTPDPDTGLRWLPAEFFGPLPEE